MLIGVLSGAPVLYLFPRVTLRYVLVEFRRWALCASAIPERHHGGTERARRTTGQPSDILMKMCRGLIDRLLLLAAFGITVQGMSQFLHLLPFTPLSNVCTPVPRTQPFSPPFPLSSILRFSLARSAAFTAPASPVSCVNNVRGVLRCTRRRFDATIRACISTNLKRNPGYSHGYSLDRVYARCEHRHGESDSIQHRSSRRRAAAAANPIRINWFAHPPSRCCFTDLVPPNPSANRVRA